MIKRLENSNIDVCKKMHVIFQLSYKIEAKLLNVTNFPPLKRPLESYLNSHTEFFGYFKDEELAGIIEIDHNNGLTNINSLVVSPRFFRQGIAKALIIFIFKTFDSNRFSVETGLDNKPAIELYKKMGFKQVNIWNSAFSIMKIKFERKINS